LNLEQLSKPLTGAVGVVCVTVLMIADTIPAEAGMGLLGALLGVGTATAAQKVKK